MKLKGINPIEKNIEKIVLGAVFVVLLAALAMQFLLKPNQVDVGGGRKVPPENIYLELANEAQQLKGKIQDRSPSLPDVQKTDLLERYRTALRTSATGVDAFPPLVQSVDVLGDVQVIADISAGGPVMTPRVPAPTAPIAHSQWGTLDPYAVEASESLARLAPPQQPYDVPAVSVEGAFSGVELGKLLAASDEGRRPIPGSWRRQVEIVRVDLERQRLDPVTGEWAKATSGTPLPTGYTPIGELVLDQADLSTMLRVASDARQNRPKVVQPRFAPLIAGPVWQPPKQAIDSLNAMNDINSLPRARFELAKAERALADLEGRKNAPATTRPQTSDPNPGGGGRLGSPSGGGGDRPGGGGASTRQNTQQTLDKRIADARDEVNKLRERVRTMESDQQQKQRDERAALDRPLFEQDSFRLWAHDFGVEPGATYRYRIRAVVNNPLFKKGAQLDPADPEQQSLTQQPLVLGDWSEWTSPVTVGADTYYFVTSASTEGQIGGSGPSASVEVYHMYYGHYRSDLTRLEPGDAIDVSVNLPDGFVTFNTAALDAQGMRRYIQSPPAAGQPAPEGVVKVATEQGVALPAYLLEVSTLPITREAALGAAARQLLQAVFLDVDGVLRLFRPTDATSDSQLQMARASAQAGQVLDLRVPDEEQDPRSGPRYTPQDDRYGGRISRPDDPDGP
ncbi:MAG: hypothetical protein R3B57_00320 [Phycisphaerales bacterium]